MTEAKNMGSARISRMLAIAVSAVIALAVSLALCASPSHAAFAESQASAPIGASVKMAAAKSGLVKKGGSYYFFKKGKMLKNAWKTVKGSKYYFKKDGKAATGSYKIKGTYYIFDAKGKLSKASKTHLVTFKKVTYQVAKTGKAKPGWASGNTKYFKQNGAMAKDEIVKVGSNKYGFDINGSLIKGVGVLSKNSMDNIFCCSSDSGVYDAVLSSKLNGHVVYEKDAKDLIAIIVDNFGEPLKTEENPSCYAADAKDIRRNYNGFVLSTVRLQSGQELFMFLDRA